LSDATNTRWKPTVNLDLLGDGQLYVAGTRRQIHHQYIKPTPFHFVEKLLQCLHDHETTPDDWCIVADEIAHGHRLDAIVRQRNQLIR
jgi:hypothetical protein